MLVAIMPTMVEACDRQGPKGPKLLLLWLFEKFSGVQVNTLDLCPCLCCQTDPLDQDHILLGDFYLLARRKERGASGQGRQGITVDFSWFISFQKRQRTFPTLCIQIMPTFCIIYILAVILLKLLSHLIFRSGLRYLLRFMVTIFNFGLLKWVWEGMIANGALYSKGKEIFKYLQHSYFSERIHSPMHLPYSKVDMLCSTFSQGGRKMSQNVS